MANLTTTGQVVAVGAGAVIAAATAPIWVPVLGLGALAAAVGTAGVAAVGGLLGYIVTKPDPVQIQQLVQDQKIKR